MPDPTNIEQIQEEKAQESRAASKRLAMQHVLMLLDPTYVGEPLDYQALVARLRTALEAEVAAPSAP